jgi:isopentenyldiphosphate isomerase
MINMEICDVFDELGNRTGRNVARGTVLSPHEYYLVVHVWLRNEANEYLIQQRAFHLASAPGIWATTAGFVLAGEASIFGAIREVHEELGVELLPVQLNRFDQLQRANHLEHIWLADVLKNAIGIPAIGSEVADWQWASKHHITQMISRGEFFAYNYFYRLPE